MKKILLTLLILGLLQGIYALGTDNFANNIFYKGDKLLRIWRIFR